MNASITLRRLPSFLGLSSVVASAISWRSWSRSLRQIHARKQLADGLRADAGGEAVLAELLDRLVVLPPRSAAASPRACVVPGSVTM